MLAPIAISWPCDLERHAQRIEDPVGDRQRVRRGPRSSSSRTANSSPPSRAARSPVADARPEPVGDGDQQPVAGRVAERVVDDLEVVEVEEQDDRHVPVAAASRAASSTRSRNRLRFARPVSGSW